MPTEHIVVQGNVSEESFQWKITEGIFAFGLPFTRCGFSSSSTIFLEVILYICKTIILDPREARRCFLSLNMTKGNPFPMYCLLKQEDIKLFKQAIWNSCVNSYWKPCRRYLVGWQQLASGLYPGKSRNGFNHKSLYILVKVSRTKTPAAAIPN